MVYSIPKDESQSIEDPENDLEQSEIELAKKASRAFAVAYVNGIYHTIKSIDPSLVEKIKILKKYPFYLYVFIYQKTPGKIDELEIYCERKFNGDGLSEVKEIYHSCEFDETVLENKKKSLPGKDIHWRWSSLEISKMYMMAKFEGKRVGRSIYEHSLYSSDEPSHKSFLDHYPGTPAPS